MNTSNSIIKLLSLPDDELEVVDLVEDGDVKYVTIEKRIKEHYCPNCNCKMKSKGIYYRKTRHSILQDGYKLVINVKQRRWWCDNCHYSCNDEFKFVSKGNQLSNMVPYYILYSLKDSTISANEVARRFNVSDTYVYYTVLRYLDIKRTTLPEYLCIDEVYLNLDDDHKYSLVLMDFKTKKIVDIVISRRSLVLESYFLSIPYAERKNVKYLISDMYKYYVKMAGTYFPEAISILDSFHLISWIINKLNVYINQVIKRYKKKDQEKLNHNNYIYNEFNNTIKDSDEVYILKKHRWVLLKNDDNIDYSLSYYDNRLCMRVDTYSNINMFLKLDKHFKPLREYKEMYVKFNSRKYDDVKECEADLNKLIEIYSNCDEVIFRDFRILLIKYKKQILNSFTYLDERRLSNGLIEGFNHEIKDLKRSARGFNRFDYVRNRILWGNRNDINILGSPKKLKDVQTVKGPKRGPYNK